MENPRPNNRKPIITPEHEAEAAALKGLFEAFKERTGTTQMSFAHKVGWSQGNVGHYLNARQPLNLAAALVFSNELQVPVGAFSPRLAAELAKEVAPTPANDNIIAMLRDLPPELRTSVEAHVLQLWQSLKIR